MTSFQNQSAPIDVRKFQFDDFDGEELLDANGESLLPELVEETYTGEDLNATQLAADAAGHARGVAETEASIEADIARLLDAIADRTGAIMTEQRTQRETIGAEAVRLATLIARKALPAMAEAGALQEIEALIARCLSERPEEPRLVIRVNDALLDKVQERLDGLKSEAGFAGKPILLADPALKASEVRIEWSNGGVDWSFDNQLADIEAAARRLVAKPAKSKRAESAHDDTPLDDGGFDEPMDITDAPSATTDKSLTTDESE